MRGEPTASPEMRLGWMQAHNSTSLSGDSRKLFLDIPLIALINGFHTRIQVYAIH
jgi:hypothetical protein